MPYQSSINVIGNFFKITFIENPGMAFGLQIGGKLFLSLFTIFATLLLIGFLYKNRNEGLLLRLALSFILGGAIGNLIDRIFYGKIYDYAPIFYGKVVDFLHFDFPNFTIFGKNIYSWPIFNIADVFVTIGFLMILIGYKRIFNTEEKDQNDLMTGEVLIQGNDLAVPENSIQNADDTLLQEEYKKSLVEPEFPVQKVTDTNLNLAKEKADIIDLKNDESVKLNIEDNKTDLKNS